MSQVSSIAWLENDIFLVVYTPNETEDDAGMIPASDYYIIHRRPQAPFLFQNLPYICMPYGVKRTPAHQFLARLRDFKPHLKDAIIVSSTAATDIGLITRATQQLGENTMSDEEVTNVFVSTTISDEVRQASIPMTENGDETSTIGLAIDLSSTEKVESPLLEGEIEASDTPLPNVLVLNNEGMLMSWWFIYADSIKQKVPYSGLASVQGIQPAQTPSTQPQQAPTAPPAVASFGSPQAQQSQPAFGQPAFGKPAFGQPGFGTPQSKPAFGQTSTPAFGTPSPLGANKPSAFGGGGFGTTTPMKPAAPAFGSPSPLGQRTPQFGQSGFAAMAGSTPAFGQTSNLAGKGFGSFASPGGGQSGFAAAAASAGGFASLAGASSGFGAIAANKPSESPFAKKTTDSIFEKSEQTTLGGAQPAESSGKFGLGSGSFVLGTTFKAETNGAKDHEPAKSAGGGAFSLGDSLGNLLSDTSGKASASAEPADEKMEDEPAAPPADAPPAPTEQPSGPGAWKPEPATTVDTSQPTTSKAPSAALSPLSSQSEKTVVPGPLEAPLPPDATSRAEYGPGDTSASSSSYVSKEPSEDTPFPPDSTKTPAKTEPPKEKVVEDAPLPPDFIPKKKETPKEVEDAPLPPDFIPKKKEEASIKEVEDAPLPPDFLPQTKKTETVVAEDAPLPPDFLPTKKEQKTPAKDEGAAVELPQQSEGSDGDFADSGEDLGQEISSPSEPAETEASASFKFSPESSFGRGPSAKLSAGDFFTKISLPGKQPHQQKLPSERPSRSLFGEISRPSFPAPKTRDEPKTPRSPSPVRQPARTDLLGQVRPSKDLIEEEDSKVVEAERQRRAAEAQQLSSDDEADRVRAELSRPISPVPTLDPFIPRQVYAGESFKPGIPGQIERLYRDINSMLDTIGLNSRALAGYLLHEETRSSPLGQWQEAMLGDSPMEVLDADVSIAHIDEINRLIQVLHGSLREQQLADVQGKIEACRQLLSEEILPLRGQCANIRKTLDSYTDSAAVRSAALSAEQAHLQQDLRKATATVQSQLADLESAVSLLRAKIADYSRGGGLARQATKKPTVEAVTSTISTMMHMVEKKSVDVDMLEAQIKQLGLDVAPPQSPAREASPFTTPRTKTGLRFPRTPESRDGSVRSAYHTPDSAGRLRMSGTGSARRRALRSAEPDGLAVAAVSEGAEWKQRARRRKAIVASLKQAMEGKAIQVRTLDDV